MNVKHVQRVSSQADSCIFYRNPIGCSSPSKTPSPRRSAFLSLILYGAAVVDFRQLRSSMRVNSLLKAALPSRGACSPIRNPRIPFSRSMASVAAMTSSTKPALPSRHLTTTSGDFCQSNPHTARKQLGLYGLTPPNVESFEVQSQRCRFLTNSPFWPTQTNISPRPEAPRPEAHSH